MHLILYETSGQWAALLRRRLPSDVILSETRSIEEVLQQLRKSPTALVLLHLDSQNGERLADFLARIRNEFYQAIAVILADRALQDWRHLMRELGAIDFIDTPRQIGSLIDLIKLRRYAAAVHDGAIEPILPLEEQIFATLPWGD